MSLPADQIPRTKAEVTTPLRFVTAASLFDGHDAAINIMRRLIQAQGAEVIHLGHNRSVLDIVRAAIQEDADAIAISSYQGGHIEFFKYMVDLLRERNSEHIRIFGGGGGTITPDEIRELEAYGVERIYHPDDGMGMGLVEMIEDVVKRAARHRVPTEFPGQPDLASARSIANLISALEDEVFGEAELKLKRREWEGRPGQAPVIGITGTGGAGKSSVTDELLNRFIQHYPEMKIAVLAVDPTRRRTGGALLGDRIRMNSLRHENIYMRSMATRRQHLATSAILQDAIAFLKSAGFDLVIVETAGIGQSDFRST
jgi:methylmalonyl-CoA mutase